MNIDENNNRDNLLMAIVVYINEKLSYDFQQSVDNVIILICDQIQQYHAIIGDVEYLDYIKENLPHHKGLSIYGSGNPILDNTRVGNLFMEIDRLKAEFNNSAYKEQNNSTQGSLFFHHCIKNAEKVIKESGVDYHLRDVKHWLNDITNHLRQVPSDYKHLERWFALMEDHATTNTQRYDFGQLKEHFEQLKQQPTPQAETTSSQLPATQDEDAGGEVQTGTEIDWETLKSFFKPKFLGLSKENKYNYFDEYLKKDILTIEKKNEFAMVALLIYRSDFFNKKTMKFAAWMRVFFKIVGVKPPVNDSKSRYEPNERITQTFRYL